MIRIKCRGIIGRMYSYNNNVGVLVIIGVEDGMIYYCAFSPSTQDTYEGPPYMISMEKYIEYLNKSFWREIT